MDKLQQLTKGISWQVISWRDMVMANILASISWTLDTKKVPRETLEDFADLVMTLGKICYKKYLRSNKITKEEFDIFESENAEGSTTLYKAYIENDTETFFSHFVNKNLPIVKKHFKDYFYSCKLTNKALVLQLIQDKYPLLHEQQNKAIEKNIEKRDYINSLYDDMYLDIQDNIADSIKHLTADIDTNLSQKEYYIEKGKIIMYILFDACIDKKFIETRLSELFREKLDKEAYDIQLNNIKKYMKEDFFNNTNKRYYGWDDELTKRVDSEVGWFVKIYHNISSGTKNRYKNKNYYKNLEKSYREHYIERYHQLDHSPLSKKDIWKHIDAERHQNQWIRFVLTEIQWQYKEEHERREAEKQQLQAQKTMKKQEQDTDTSIAKTKPGKEERFKDSFNKIVTNLEESTQKKLQKSIEDIKSYIVEKYNARSNVRMRYIKKTLWDSFPEELRNFVENLCTELDIKIVEIEEAYKQLDTETTLSPMENKSENKSKIVESEDDPKKTSWPDEWHPTPQKNINISPTLKKLSNKPEELTTEKIIDICEELGYRFMNKTIFCKQAASFWLDQTTKQWLWIKKKIITKLSMPDDLSWEPRSSGKGKGCANYERIDLWQWNRLVKQGKVILCILKHQDYEDFINTHFTKWWKNYDTLYDDLNKKYLANQ